MAPQDDFKAGDIVEVVGMPESSGMNGTVGELVKTVGKGRWAIKVEGDDRSKVVSVDNLQKRALQPKRAHAAGAPKKYSIVGTWDDWEPSEMTWNAEGSCFEHRIIMGDNGTESFKILLDDNWDKCVYPSCKDASPHVQHELRGPDDGGLDEEWTIGIDPKDNSAEGVCFKVRLICKPDGEPMRVTWESLRKEAPGPVVPEAAAVPAVAPRPAAPPPAPAPRPARLPEGDDEDPMRDARGEPPPEDSLAVYNAGIEISEQEREARERLARRFQDAELVVAQAAPEGGAAADTDQHAVLMYSYDRELHNLEGQIESNLERYRESIREYAGAPRVELVVRRPFGEPDTCVECGIDTDNILGPVGRQQPGKEVKEVRICKKCFKETEEQRKAGWDPLIVCDGLSAGRRAEELVGDGSLSRSMARTYIMKKYPHHFQN